MPITLPGVAAHGEVWKTRNRNLLRQGLATKSSGKNTKLLGVHIKRCRRCFLPLVGIGPNVGNLHFQDHGTRLITAFDASTIAVRSC